MEWHTACRIAYRYYYIVAGCRFIAFVQNIIQRFQGQASYGWQVEAESIHDEVAEHDTRRTSAIAGKGLLWKMATCRLLIRVGGA